MIYAAITTADGQRVQGIYNTNEYNALTFSPETVTHYTTQFAARNKQEARKIAMSLKQAESDTVNNGGIGLSWAECDIIAEGLEYLARRFGLVREFRENGII